MADYGVFNKQKAKPQVRFLEYNRGIGPSQDLQLLTGFGESEKFVCLNGLSLESNSQIKKTLFVFDRAIIIGAKLCSKKLKRG